MLAWAGAMWTFPDGDWLCLAALAIPIYPRLVAGAMRSRPEWPLPGVAEQAGVWWGLAVFSAVLPNADRLAKIVKALPTLDWPYRPDVLYPLLTMGVAVGYTLTARRLKRHGWSTVSAGLTAVISLALAVGTGYAVLFFANRL